MATCKDCKDCLHYELCGVFDYISPDECGFYDRFRFVELPDVGDYDTVTTITEAINHCYQIATSTDESIYAKCKAEHMRLCEWLGDLKRRIIAEQTLKRGKIND